MTEINLDEVTEALHPVFEKIANDSNKNKTELKNGAREKMENHSGNAGTL